MWRGDGRRVRRGVGAGVGGQGEMAGRRVCTGVGNGIVKVGNDDKECTATGLRVKRKVEGKATSSGEGKQGEWMRAPRVRVRDVFD